MTNCLTLHYREHGDGPPLLILHGLFGAGGNWGRVARQLAADYRVILVDLRNHGQSPHHPDMRYPTMAADVLALMDRLSLERPIVLGHSMGGKVAMTLALAHPARVGRLVIVDIAPVPYAGDSHEDLISAMQALDLEAVTSRRSASDALAGAIPEAGVRQFLLTNLEQRDGVWRWRIPLTYLRDGLATVRDFPEIAGAFTGQSLFLHGGRSPYVHPDHHSSIRKRFPNSKIVGLQELGHWLHAEAPDLVYTEISRFLAESRT